MAWISASFELDTQQADALSDALLEQGAVSVDLEDAAAGTPDEHALFGEPGAPAGPAWPRQRIRALFPAPADVRAAVAAALESIGLQPPGEVALATVPEQDWVRATQAQFAPIQVTPRLWIVPSWSTPPDLQAINLRLDPGQAFGTGSHPTTWQCLQWLDGNLVPGNSVVDYGCGSGVLAIAACKLGAGRAVAVDIDPVAVAVTRENAHRNDVRLLAALADEVPPGPYDLVLANILANPLRVLAPLLAGLVRPGGRIVLAGILSAQADDLVSAYRAWFELRRDNERDGWVCLTGVRGR